MREIGPIDPSTHRAVDGIRDAESVCAPCERVTEIERERSRCDEKKASGKVTALGTARAQTAGG